MNLHQLISKLSPHRTHLATTVDSFYDTPSLTPRDRFTYDRDETLRQCLEAWRVNPLARRIVELTSQYVVGGGISIGSRHPGTQRFLDAWWHHPLNHLPVRVFELCDELTRSGELFLALSTDAAGMSFVRAIPASEIAEIHTAENDLEQELSYRQRPALNASLEAGRLWPAYNPLEDQPDENGRFPVVMLHYAINRPAGAVHGESDLAPLLRWLVRYAAWLEDRARLNRFRQTFLFVVRARFAGEADRQARQAALNAAPPPPGSVLVTDSSEEWSVLSPRLDSSDAAMDGLALKKMIAAGSGLPMHFLAEPESATRTTAESAGGPTFRRFEQRQVFFLWLLRDLAQATVRRRALLRRGVDPQAHIEVRGADISARDNAALSIAASTIAGAFKDLRDRALIDDQELLRMVYKFAGEVVDIEALLRAAVDAQPASNPPQTSSPGAGRPPGVRVDPLTGELKGSQIDA